MDCFVASLLAMTKNGILQITVPQHPSAIHLVFEIDHRRPGEVPNEARARGTAADNRVGEDEVDIMHGVSLRRRRVLPATSELGHALFHHADDIADLLRDPVGTEVAAATVRSAQVPPPSCDSPLPAITKVGVVLELGRVKENA